MAYSEQNIREKNAQASAAHGQQASSELKQSMKAMRRALNESLNERLAEAVEQAQQTAQAQKNAKEAVDQSAKEKKRGEPIAPEKQDNAARTQADAQEGLNQLQRDLQALSKQSRFAGEQPLAEGIEKAQKDLDDAKTPQRMAQAQKDIKDRNWPSARQNQQAAAASTSGAHERLKDLYQDQTALPMQKMKNAMESTQQLANDVKDVQKKVEKLDTQKSKPGERGKGEEAQKVAQDQNALQKKAESLTDRLKRIDPTAQDLKQNAEDLNAQMKQAAEKLAKGQTKDVSPGLNKASKALQSIGEGLLQRLNRLADKEKRRDPEEEKAPPEYRKLVEQYSRALSED
jgi:chromosome segregation ATPase